MAEKCISEEGPAEREAHRHAEPPCADPQLLERFIKRGDQTAFALLLKRHGPMVWTVCRRLLQHVEDAEDAFQATFLVLARNAARIQKRELLANWLYGVAYKVAAHSRAKIARRQSREAPDLVVETVPAAETEPSDMQAVLQEEVHSLPAKYRAPIVLCYLQGKSNEEAAADLRCPVGTVKGRLARAREMLRKRAVRRGLALSVAALVTELVAHTAGVMPPALPETTATAVARFAGGEPLSEGYVSPNAAALTQHALTGLHSAVVRSWILRGVWGAAALVFAGAIGLFVWLRSGPGDAALLQGPWRMVSITSGGKTSRFDQIRWIFKDDRVMVEFKGPPQEMKLQFDEHQRPKTIDFILSPQPGQGPQPPMLGLYELRDDILTIALTGPGQPRAKDFSGRDGVTVMVFRRDKGP